MTRLSIRWKLTLSSIAAVAIVLVGAFFLTHWQVSRILVDANASLASADLESFANDIANSRGEHVDDPAAGVLVYIRAPAGSVEQDSMPHTIHEAVEHVAVASGQSTISAEGTTYVMVGETVRTSTGEWDLWAARSNASIPVVLGRLDRELALGLGALLLLLALASYLIASAALRPVTRLRTAAESLAVDSLRQGEAPALPVGDTRDEIALLATTLNGFLSDIHAASARERHMVSDAAHELRTPLAVLRTQLELAHDHAGDAIALEHELVRAEGSVSRLSALASNLLELSRLEARQVPTGSSSTEQLAEEVLAAVDRARLLATSRNIEIGFRLESPTAAASVAVDAVSFARIIDNLLANAVAAVDTVDGKVDVRLYSVDNVTTVEVVDNGHGMPEEFIARAFDRFSRPDYGRTSREGGAGLGLSLVQGIARSAGGEARIIPGEHGVIVRVSLPNMR
jgi:two-component system, OmpR family, sensor kinase